MIDASSDIEPLARTVEDNGGMYIVPAFSGLFAPYWRSDARGVVVGLTRYINRGHFARAVLESTAYQVREVLDAMEKDSGVKLTSLKVDGGMVVNDLLMQFQADLARRSGSSSPDFGNHIPRRSIRCRLGCRLLERFRSTASQLGKIKGMDTADA